MTNHDLIGSSLKFRTVLDEIKLVALADSGVLIQGETGTGKEVIARAIHASSSRRNNRFAALNCAAIPGTLLESDLFGHERGAFTGAISQKMGRFETANCGTLFLDEIGDLPLELQPKLLRALQEQEFERLGSNRPVRVDVRVIAATNQDLWKMVQERKFRADLYYRLNVYPIMLPPLRERKDDIPLLVEHFVREFAKRHGKSISSIPNGVLERLKNHYWPGNIRELQNCIERAVIRTMGTVLQLSTAEFAPDGFSARPVRTLADAQRAHITATLRDANWVLGGPQGAAARLELPRTTLIDRMKKLGIVKPTLNVADGEDVSFATELDGEFTEADAVQSSAQTYGGASSA